MSASFVEIAGAVVFVLALAHTFSTAIFQRLAHRYPRHAATFHLLGEIEVAFGFWAMVLGAVILISSGRSAAIAYADGRNDRERAQPSRAIERQ